MCVCVCVCVCRHMSDEMQQLHLSAHDDMIEAQTESSKIFESDHDSAASSRHMRTLMRTLMRIHMSTR
jgi:hypothetical protein